MKKRSRLLRLALVAMMGAVIFVPYLGGPALWEPDEGRYAEIAREMLARRDYITPCDDWVPYLEKPPLMYWLTAVSLHFLGHNEMAARLPVACMSIASLTVCAYLGELMFGPATGVLASLCLGVSPLFFGFSRFLTLDPALTFFVTAGLTFVYIALNDQSHSTSKLRLYLVLGSICAALGTLTKGPIAALLIGGVAILFLAAKARLQQLRILPWTDAAVIYALITLPWFILASWRIPGFLSFFFIHEHIYRYFLSTEHPWGVWFLPCVTLLGLWPWTVFIPTAIADARINREHNNRDATDFLLLWAGLIVALFSLGRSKLGSYVLPAMPALAILAARGITLILTKPKGSAAYYYLAVALVNLSALIALIFVGLTLQECAHGVTHASGWFKRTGAIAICEKLALDSNLVVVAKDICLSAGALSVGGLLCSAVMAITSRKRLAFGAAVMCAVLSLIILVKARYDAAPLGSYRSLARAINNNLKPECALVSYRHLIHSLPFYTGAREVIINYKGELAPFSDFGDAAESFVSHDEGLKELWRNGRCVIVVADKRAIPKLNRLLSDPAPRYLGEEGDKIAVSNSDESRSPR